MNKSDDKNLYFQTHVQLKSIIGQDLIHDDNIAIQELLKNAIDAGSKETIIEFKDCINSPKLIITDTGKGMTLRDIDNKWLNIAYSEKKNRQTKDAYLAGSKGIGRFSCDRLGEDLDLYTKTNDDTQYLHLNIEWKKFEIDEQDARINEVALPYSYTNNLPIHNSLQNHKHGTSLVISKLRHNWSKKDITALIKTLEKLLNPNIGLQVNAPQITVIANDFNIKTKIVNSVFQELNCSGQVFLATDLEQFAQ
jgi:DNA topoisomerase VI subunit B